MTQESDPKMVDTLLELGETRLKELVSELSHNPVWIRAVGAAVETSRETREFVIGLSRGVLENMDLPKKAEIDSLEQTIRAAGEQIKALEERLAALNKGQ